jgi:hypothetical protein
MTRLSVNQIKRARGLILDFVYRNHWQQKSRLDHITIWGDLRDLGFQVSENDVLTLLQELKSGGYLQYREKETRKDGEFLILEIEITADGRKVIEKDKIDPLVAIW